MRQPTAVLLLSLTIAASGMAAPEIRVLPADFSVDKSDQMMRSFQRRRVHAALDRRLRELEEALESGEGIARYQTRRKAFLKDAFGRPPGEAPLNPRITGRIRRDGFSIEKLIIESLPGYHVTANVYRPDGPGPFPGVLLPCGHSANGKAYESYQKAAALLARHGFVTLCFDPVGQGERRQLIGPKPGPIQRRSEHNDLGVAPLLLGRSLGAMMVWDGMRCIDYLCGRPDVDPARIGCTGNSGGGNLTSYLMAFDDRIVAAAPGCFMTTHRRKNEKPGPGDAEQNLFAQIREGFDHADFMIVRAPKPTLILAATRDFVPIEGTWEAFRQAKRVYAQLGHPERIDLIEANEKHGFTQRLREGVVRFFARWLQGRNIEVFESDDVSVLTDAELQATEPGQVLWLEGARSIFDVFRETERRLAGQRPAPSRDLVRKATGIRRLKELPAPEIREVSAGVPRKRLLHPEPGISLPALHWPGGSGAPVLLAPGNGMNSAVAKARELHAQGSPVLIVEVRDTGETKTRNWRFHGADSYIGQMLGRSWLTMRAEDLLVSARWLAQAEKVASVQLQADGEVAPAALHAAFLEPELIQDVETVDGLPSWRSLMTDRNAHRAIHQAVHGVLQFYDLPDL